MASSDEREVTILVARDDLSITRASSAPGRQITKPHIHHQHTDAFFVLEGELMFVLEGETVVISAGEFIAVPPETVHSFRTRGEGHARWLTIHAPDGGFAAFIRGARDGLDVKWDVSAELAPGAARAHVNRQQ
jgi:mannose-6-phosphate isomerase-like protein (cupin superfamily)